MKHKSEVNALSKRERHEIVELYNSVCKQQSFVL